MLVNTHEELNSIKVFPNSMLSMLFGILVLQGMLSDLNAKDARPNVLLIVCDDLNDSIEGFGGHPQAQTPYLNRLAQTGVRFQQAYSNNPVCAPSRASFLTGIYPHSSGNLFWDKWFNNPVLNNSKTLMTFFQENGYHVAGTGKLMHFFRKEEWSEFKHKADYGPIAWNGNQRTVHPSVPMPFRSIGPIDGSFGSLANVPHGGKNGAGWIHGGWGKEVQLYDFDRKHKPDLTPDERNAAWCEHFISNYSKTKNNKPFFLAVGFIRPHTPMHAPQRFFDKFPLESVQPAMFLAKDEEDTHFRKNVLMQEDGVDGLRKGHHYFRDIKASYNSLEDGLRAYTQAYLACVAAVDECIGKVVKAVDDSPHRRNTIIIVTSDHGFQLGEKNYLFKNSPWEESCRVPLIIRAPGISQAGSDVTHPVSLIDIYPTLVDLCDLEGDTRKNSQGKSLDGYSMRPFLENPKSDKWEGPNAALTMVYAGKASENQIDKQHWTLRTKQWRYIRYGNGDEELYDHKQDPYEWKNLEDDPNHKNVKESLRKQLQSLIH